MSLIALIVRYLMAVSILAPELPSGRGGVDGRVRGVSVQAAAALQESGHGGHHGPAGHPRETQV